MADYTDDDLKREIKSITSNMFEEIHRAAFYLRILKNRSRDNVEPALYEQETRFNIMKEILLRISGESLGLEDDYYYDDDEEDNEEVKEKKNINAHLKALTYLSEEDMI